MERIGSWEDDLDYLMEQHEDKTELLVGEVERHRIHNVAISGARTDSVKGVLSRSRTYNRVVLLAPSRWCR